MKRYVLITPARNEEAFIENTICSVICQTVMPIKWCIVSDGSTDRTDEIVERYRAAHPFIELLRSAGIPDEGFQSKVRAFNVGYAAVSDLDFDFIGNLDADVTFSETYFGQLMLECERDPKLGIVGGEIIIAKDGGYASRGASLNSVAGAVQFFTKRCFEMVGGFLPLKYGGEDAAAEIRGRMLGWKTRTIAECPVLHPRPVLSGGRNILVALYRNGITRHMLGYHPLFQTAICLRRMFHSPFIVGGMAMLLGYWMALLRRIPTMVPKDQRDYLRREQLGRLGLP